MFLFVVYGCPGMRGVQTKAIRLAKYLEDHGHKTFFYSHSDKNYDALPLIQNKFKYKEWDFMALQDVNQISFPKNTEAVIFTDLPTNLIGELTYFLAAKKNNIPTIVIDNFYRDSQLEERVFKNVFVYADLVLLNGLFLPSKKYDKNIHIVGPFIREPKSKEEIKKWIKDLGIKKNDKIIIGSGYNPDVLEELKKLAKKIQGDIIILGLGGSKKIERTGKLILLPFLDDQEINSLLSIADLMISKFGFIQVVECLIAGVPIIITGSDRGFFSEWLDPELNKLIIESNNSEQLFRKTEEILSKNYINKIKISKRLLAPKDSLKIAIKLIENVKLKTNKPKKILVFSFDDEESIQNLKTIIRKNLFAYPVIFSLPTYRSIDKNKNLNYYSFNPTEPGEILNWGFEKIYRMSSADSIHGISSVLPFATDIINEVKELIKNSNETVYTSEEVKNFIKPLLIS